MRAKRIVTSRRVESSSDHVCVVASHKRKVEYTERYLAIPAALAKMIQSCNNFMEVATRLDDNDRLLTRGSSGSYEVDLVEQLGVGQVSVVASACQAFLPAF